MPKRLQTQILNMEKLMKLLALKTLLMTLCLVAFDPQLTSETAVANQGSLLACPRCRKATPPGPSKIPQGGNYEITLMNV